MDLFLLYIVVVKDSYTEETPVKKWTVNFDSSFSTTFYGILFYKRCVHGGRREGGERDILKQPLRDYSLRHLTA